MTINKHITPLNSSRIFSSIEKENSMCFGLKNNELENAKKKYNNLTNRNSCNKFFFQKPYIVKIWQIVLKIKKINISIIKTNKMESLTKEIKDKNEKFLPRIASYLDKNKNTIINKTSKTFLLKKNK